MLAVDFLLLDAPTDLLDDEVVDFPMWLLISGCMLRDVYVCNLYLYYIMVKLFIFILNVIVKCITNHKTIFAENNG